ncbi:four-carbon acid sugar kinase family protein [Natronorarus salvus]|uniref:four-carbon acid sugar kinase family protein n=1 Tax=Natronorarus salvus TaxID=3117733 RepID=UPI002F264C0C
MTGTHSTGGDPDGSDPVRGLVVADDLTGATDTGHQFAARGFETTVRVTDDDGVDCSDVVVHNTDSRYRSEETAADRVSTAIDAHPDAVVYKKVDSTLRGNLVAEIGAAAEATDADLVLVAPAFPATGRVTVGGVHVVEGRPVAETAAGRDPDSPVADSHVPTLLSDLGYPVDHLPLTTVERGADGVRDHLTSLLEAGTGGDDPTVVVCDAARDGHLETLAAAASRPDLTVLYVGSGGLARYVRFEPATAGGVLGVVGSASPRTFDQLGALDEGWVVVVNTDLSVRDPGSAAREAADRAADAMGRHGVAVLTAATSATDVEATLAAGSNAGLTEAETRNRISTVLARSAKTVADRGEIGGLFATGGAVATRLLESLGATGVSLTGREITSGVPVSRIADGPAAGTPFVTKAGAFGDERTIYMALLSLSRHDG